MLPRTMLLQTPLRLVCVVVALSACASNVSGTQRDASADAVDATPLPDVNTDVAPDVSARCAWRVGARVDLITGTATRCDLVDLVAANDGVWILRECDVRVTSTWELSLEHLGTDLTLTGQARLASGAMRPMSVAQSSIAVDDARDRRAALVATETPSLRGFDARGNLTWQRSVGTLPTSFSLGGHRDVAVTQAGFSVVADQIRALWGGSLLRTDAMGATADVVDLRLPTAQPARFSRFALPDGGFVVAWRLPGAMGASASLWARRYDEAGASSDDARRITDLPTMDGRFVLRPWNGSLVALWEAEADTLPPLRGLAMRRLDASALPTIDTVALTALGFYGGGFDAAAARGDLLVAAVTGSGVLQLTVLPVRTDGAPPSELLAVGPVEPMAPDAMRARLVATATGALVAYRRTAAVVSVAALTCAP
mgnify:CR=1 FL=1